MNESLTPDKYRRLCDIVDQACQLPATQRIAFLETECAQDAHLFERARQMLGSLEEVDARSFLKRTAPLSLKSDAKTKVDPLLGAQVGHYQVESRISSGGMGTVYRAVRIDDYRQPVAIKVIRQGMDSASILDRFRNERQVLASLRHANIATILDGGSFTDGRPYFVMELIDGEAITEFADRNRLTTAHRLRLFQQVAAGVQFAHQRAVLHRDLKPSNILVTKSGEVKLVDFGIAKVTQAAPDGQPEPATRAEDRAWTPDYASPEQVRGEVLSTASDVYSLGVVLYELLSGHRPYDLTGMSLTEVERTICESPTEPPSKVIERTIKRVGKNGTQTIIDSQSVSSVRDGNLALLRRRLQGDIDTIVLKALRKEPDRRYASVEQLAADIDRHLTGRPVTARRDTWWYRTQKFIRRNRLAVTAAAVSILTLVLGLTGTTFGLRRAIVAEDRAQHRFDQVRDLATTSVFDFHDQIVDLPGSTPAREFVVKKGLEYLDNLAVEAADDPELMYRLCHAYLRAGHAAGDPNRSSLGKIQEALQAYGKAEELARRLNAIEPDNLDYTCNLLSAREAIADIVAVTKSTEEAYRTESELNQQTTALLAQHPDVLVLQRNSLMSLTRLAAYQSLRGNFEDAVEKGRAARSQALKIAGRLPDDPESQRGVYRACNAIALAHAKTGRYLDAKQSTNEALTAIDGLEQRHTATVDDAFIRAACYLMLGDCDRKLSAFEQSRQEYTRALQILEPIAVADSKNLRAQMSFAEAESDVAAFLTLVQQPAEGLKMANDARARLEPFISEGHSRLINVICDIDLRIADAEDSLDKPKEALDATRRCVTLADEQLRRDSSIKDHFSAAALAHRLLGKRFCTAKIWSDAIDETQKARTILDEMQRQFPPEGQHLTERFQLQMLVTDIHAGREEWKPALESCGNALSLATAGARNAPNDYSLQSFVLQSSRALAIIHRTLAGIEPMLRLDHLRLAERLCDDELNLWKRLIDGKCIPQEELEFANDRVSGGQAFLKDLREELASATH